MSKKHALGNFLSLALAISSLALIGGLFTPAQAGHIACGAILGPGGVHVLDSDVGPCDNANKKKFAIRVKSSAKLNLNGFSVSCADTNGDGRRPDGIVVRGNLAEIFGIGGINGVSACKNGVFIRGNKNKVGIITSVLNTRNGFDIAGNGNELTGGITQGNDGNGFLINGNLNDLLDTVSTDNGINGFFIKGGTGNLLQVTRAELNQNGYLIRSNSNGLDTNTAENNLANGFEIIGQKNILIENKSTGHTAGHGFLIQGDRNELRPDPNIPGTRNFAENNSGAGFKIIGNLNILKENEASTNTEEGFKIEGNRNKLQENIAFFNGANGFEDGFDIEGDNNILIDNSAEANTRDGFEISGEANQVLRENLAGGNLAEGNGQNGFSISGNFNALDGNTANDNVGLSFSIGIRIENGFVGNDITNNTATGNFAVDLVDENGDCARNAWISNTFGTKDPDCIQ